MKRNVYSSARHFNFETNRDNDALDLTYVLNTFIWLKRIGSASKRNVHQDIRQSSKLAKNAYMISRRSLKIYGNVVAKI